MGRFTLKHKENLIKVLMCINSVAIFFMILTIAIRGLITPAYARFAYRLPAFPDDSYGFTFEDRLHWSEPSIKYLVNNEGISYLEDLKFEDGNPIFNERELSHMKDVKSVVSGMRLAMAVLAIGILVSLQASIHSGKKQYFLKAMHFGGWLTIGLILAILLFIALSFDTIFSWFHQLFFESGTWQFYTSDTLIRLFPLRFWRDAFIFVALQSLLYAGILIFFTRNKPQTPGL